MSKLWLEVLICFLAGAGAGLGTGFAGMSAATVISPMLITFLGLPAYDAIGIALASDVLASAASARTYAKSGAIDLKNGLVMMCGVLCMTMVGSWLSTMVPNRTLGGFSVIMTLVLGLKFLLLPVKSGQRTLQGGSRWQRILKGALGGACIGLICGFFGAGGGMMMLMVLTVVLGYELKTAVGTSVFVMTFSALTGAVSHFALGAPPRLDLLVLCVIFTLLWAQIAAHIATRASSRMLNRLTGVILTVLGVILVGITYF
ncbi:sulfite exporter TauE/SafE family protein [Flavonifractor hominis]|uniref:Probable membrane transporter protein n=1 Tax=Flavonifractor hominis TaxID=3133178 RepID=A0ABV1ERP1_9FIRM